MELILVHPEIPHNTGCAGRLAAALGLPLHLVRPLGFELSDRYLKRAGLDCLGARRSIKSSRLINNIATTTTFCLLPIKYVSE